MFSPLLVNWAKRFVKLAEEDGKLAVASEAIETLPSFLPVKTGHIFLWNCKIAMVITCVSAIYKLYFSRVQLFVNVKNMYTVE